MVMKKYFILLIVIISTANYSYSQTYEQVGWIAKFGLAVGVTAQWNLPDFNPINEKLAALGLENFPESGLITYGGGGYAYLMFIENLRIGGMGFSGSVSRNSTINSINKEVVYSTGGGALTLEYTIPAIKKIAVSVGVMIGGGSTDIEIFENTSNLSWNDVWNNIPGSSYQKIKNSYYNISPIINMDIPFNRFLALRVGTGYQFTIFNDWEYNNARELNEVPSNLNSDMFFIQVGVFVGFFAF